MASCLALDDYARCLSQIVAEAENFKAIEPGGENYLEALRKEGQFQLGTGDANAAAETFRALSAVIAEKAGKQSAEYYGALASEGAALMQAKKYPEAREYYTQALAGFRAMPDAGEDFLDALYQSAYLDYLQSSKAAATKALLEFVTILEHNDLTSDPRYAAARKMISSLTLHGEGQGSFLLPADSARALFEKGFNAQMDKPREALSDFEACERICALHGIVDNTSFSCYINHARLLFAMASYDRCSAMLERARHDATTLYGGNSAEYGHVQILQADLALHAADVREASSLYRLGVDNLRNGDAAAWVKQIRWASEQLIGAKAGEQAIPLLSTVLHSDKYRAFETRDKIALHELNARAYFECAQTAKLLQEVNVLAKSEKDIALRQTFMLILSQANRELGNLTAAHAHALDGIALADEGIVSGELYFESARGYQQLGNYKDAEIAYRKALERIPASPSSETVLPLIFNSLAAFYIQLGNYAAAEKFFLNLLSTGKGSSAFYNSVRQILAALYEKTGRYGEAKKLLRQTLAADALLGTDHPDYAVALQNLAAVYLKLHQLDSAQLLYEEALRIGQDASGKQSLASATMLANLGTVYQEGKNFDAARRMYERALAIRKDHLSPDHPDYAYGQYLLANLLYRTHKPTEALPLFRAAGDFYIRQIHDVFPALSDYERTAFYNRVHEVISAYEMFLLENISLGKDLPATLLDFRLQTKALLLNSSLKVRNQILHSGDASLVGDFNVWQHTKDQIAFLLSLTKEERTAHADLLEEYVQKADALEKSLSLRSQEFARTFISGDAGWRDVQAVLHDGEAALEIMRVKLPDSDSVVYGALLVKPGLAEPFVAVFPNGNFLEQKAFNAYINSIQFQLEDTRSYGAFWKKLEPALADVRNLYISPDGVFTKINCATLYDPATRQYVIDRMSVMEVSNLRDLTEKIAGRTLPPHALLVGFPDYRLGALGKASDIPRSSRDASLFGAVLQDGLAELPGTQKEVVAVQGVLQSNQWNVETLLRKEALEEKIKASQNLTLLHIATHGFFLAPKNEHAKEVYTHNLRDVESNSMLRSGLLLGGAEKNLIAMLSERANPAGDDGILTAYEVMNLNLDGVDLVVLSACETGKGDVKNGEGVYGLQRAFMLAGARHVLMSLWKVDDAATQQLMVAFYREWLGGKEKMAAFHDAQVSLKQKFSHPYYWGGFVMMGR
jgi:CHAT domain-containing protein/tetratricopeptide (TPR) repeat protein